jgi:hypothetical protein
MDAGVGQCSLCAYASVQTSARGNRFWRCRRADAELSYLRYPPLPVAGCAGFENGTPQERSST